MFKQSQLFQSNLQGTGATQCCIPLDAIPCVEDCLQVEFVATVYIPSGFITAGEDYLTILNIDESSLSVNNINDAQVMLNGCAQCAKEAVTLDGTFSYNVVLDGFTPAWPVTGSNLYTYTAFTYTEEVPVWKVLGVSLYEYNIAINYNLSAEQGVPYIVDCNGRMVYKNANPNAFMSILNNPDTSKIVNVPFRITIHPYASENCGISSCNDMDQ